MKHKNLNDVLYGDRADIRHNRDVIDFAEQGKQQERCYHTHPPLKLPNSKFVIYGGSCSSPIVKDADIYIGLCHTMKQTERRFPWVKGEEIYFPIPDMSIPKDVENFKALITWTKKQIEAGAKVHVGCIGGHGRTGTFLASLVSLYGEKDAIRYVRKHYCHKAVECKLQVEFLGLHFGIINAEGYKDKQDRKKSFNSRQQPVTKKGANLKLITPVQSAMAIW